MKTYTVQRGDSLFKIAQKFYGDGNLYGVLAAYNGLENPNVLEVGQVLRIPDSSELANPLEIWHNYQSGSIYWRVTEHGIEIQGNKVIKEPKFTKQVKEIWETYGETISAASQKHGVPVPVILATISTESSGNPEAYRFEANFYKNYLKDKKPWVDNPYYNAPRRISASYGLVQILYTTAYSIGFRGEPENLYDPATNIDAGTAYIASDAQVKHHGWDPPKIACAYNAGSVRPTKENPWGMFHYPGHLDRWIPSYNGAIEILGTTEIPTTIPQQPPQIQPQPQQPSEPEEEHVTVTFIFPKESEEAWKPLIVDMFQHSEQGIGEPFSFRIEDVAETQDGYSYELPNMAKGIYDVVFTDAATYSVINDLVEVAVTSDPATIDLRASAEAEQESDTGTSTIRIRFPKIQGQAWKPVIIDIFKHTSGGLGEPVSVTIKMPSYGPEGEYIHEIPDIEYGMYDFVFTDATTKSVINDVADYTIEQKLVIVDLTTETRQTPPSSQSGHPSTQSDKQNWGAFLKDLWKKIWG